MSNYQPSLFSEREWVDMIPPTFSKKKNQAEWELRKNRLGVVRADLSKGLQTTDEGCPILKPYFGIPDCPLIDFKESLASNVYDYWIHFLTRTGVTYNTLCDYK